LYEVTNMTRCSLLVPPTRTLEQQLIIRPVGTGSGKMSIEMSGGTVASSTRSLVAFVGSCTQAWCLCMVVCELHILGMTEGTNSMPTKDPFRLLYGGHYV
jgi:hypothetical protein